MLPDEINRQKKRKMLMGNALLKVDMVMFYSYRQATHADLPELLRLNYQLDCDQWSSERFDDLFEHELPIILLLAPDGRVAGFLVYLLCLDEARILNLVIDKEYQRCGLGTRLLTHVLDEICSNDLAKYAMLEVRVSNLVAFNMYTQHGFRVISLRKDYYTDTRIEDGYLMELVLPIAPSLPQN